MAQSDSLRSNLSFASTGSLLSDTQQSYFHDFAASDDFFPVLTKMKEHELEKLIAEEAKIRVSLDDNLLSSPKVAGKMVKLLNINLSHIIAGYTQGIYGANLVLGKNQCRTIARNICKTRTYYFTSNVSSFPHI